jgi:hypothetical protein
LLFFLWFLSRAASGQELNFTVFLSLTGQWTFRRLCPGHWHFASKILKTGFMYWRSGVLLRQVSRLNIPVWVWVLLSLFSNRSYLVLICPVLHGYCVVVENSQLDSLKKWLTLHLVHL